MKTVDASENMGNNYAVIEIFGRIDMAEVVEKTVNQARIDKRVAFEQKSVFSIYPAQMPTTALFYAGFSLSVMATSKLPLNRGAATERQANTVAREMCLAAVNRPTTQDCAELKATTTYCESNRAVTHGDNGLARHDGYRGGLLSL